MSTVKTELKIGTLENAGTLTVGGKNLSSWDVNVYDLKNTGTLNAGDLMAFNSIDNTGILNLDTTQRIALGLYGKEAASGERVTFVNGEDGTLSINVEADPALTTQNAHAAGIDLFSPTNQPTMTGGDFMNLGTADITVPSTLTIDVTKTASDATYSTWGIKGNHNTTLINNGTLTINGTATAERWLSGVALYGSETTHGSFRNSGDVNIVLTESTIRPRSSIRAISTLRSSRLIQLPS